MRTAQQHKRYLHSVWRQAAKGTVRLVPAILLALTLLLTALAPSQADAATAPAGTAVYKVGQLNSVNTSALRSQPYINGGTLIERYSQGTKVEVFTEVTGEVWNGSDRWYYVRIVARNLYGYVHKSLVTLSGDSFDPAAPGPESDPAFEAALDAQGFPESYRPALRKLHSKYPGWSFVAFHAQDNTAGNPLLTLARAVEAEYRPGVNLVPLTRNRSHRTYDSSHGYYYTTDQWKAYDAGSWVGASKEILAYCLDPRNFLTEETIFQFECLSYLPEVHTLEAVQDALAGSFMANASVPVGPEDDTSRGQNGTITYAEIFMDAAEKSDVNPLFLVHRCRTEVGNGKDGKLPVAVSGTAAGYAGIYNFYNIGAYASDNPVIKGLEYAKYGYSRDGSGPSSAEKTKYLLPWNSQWKAIVGGAKWIGSGYIENGQDTSYLQKYWINGLKPAAFSHQYMGNVYAPSNESYQVYKSYQEAGILNKPYVFKIPVLTGLPSEPAPYPVGDLSRNNYLKSITLSKGSLSPAFNSEKYSYTATVDGSVDSLTISATAHHASCSIKNTGSKTLKTGLNIFTITAVAQNGEERVYTIKVTRKESSSEPPSPPPDGVAATNGYKLVDSYLTNAWPADGRNKAGQILSSLELPEGHTATAYDLAGNQASGDTSLGTGARVEIKKGDESPAGTLWLVIYGDANGDGIINAIDLSYIIDSMVKGKRWTAAQNAALDTNRDGTINAIDLSYVIDSMVRGKLIKQD